MDHPSPTDNPVPPPATAAPAGDNHATMKRVLGLTAAIGAIVGLSFVVGRQHTGGESVAVNYLATRGPRPPGLTIFLQRGPALTVLDPATELRSGDQLRFVLRASAPCFLVLRARNGAGHDRQLFPTQDAATAAVVGPDQALPTPLTIDDTPGKETVTARFSAHAFAIDAPPADNIQVVTIDLRKAP